MIKCVLYSISTANDVFENTGTHSKKSLWRARKLVIYVTQAPKRALTLIGAAAAAEELLFSHQYTVRSRKVMLAAGHALLVLQLHGAACNVPQFPMIDESCMRFRL